MLEFIKARLEPPHSLPAVFLCLLACWRFFIYRNIMKFMRSQEYGDEISWFLLWDKAVFSVVRKRREKPKKG